MIKNVLSKSLIFTVLCITGITQAWADYDGSTIYNKGMRTGACGINECITYPYGGLNNTNWGSNAILWAESATIGNQLGSYNQGNSLAGYKMIICNYFQYPYTIPAYSKLVRNATFTLAGASNRHWHGSGLYVFDTEKGATDTYVDCTRAQDQTKPAGHIKSYVQNDASGAWSNVTSGSIALTFDNSNGSSKKDISKWFTFVHVSDNGGSSGANGQENGTWKMNTPSDSWYYYKHFTFNANEGTGTAMAVQTIENSGNLTANTYTRTGYRFTGWNTSADGSGTAYTDGQAITATSSDKGAITLYAQWETVEVPVSESGYATVFSDRNLIVPAGVEVYGFTYSDGALVQGDLISPDAILRANNGYLVKATAGTYNFAPTTSSATAYESVLIGTTTEISTPSGDVFVWGKPEGYGYGFYKYTGATIPAGRAYYVKQ